MRASPTLLSWLRCRSIITTSKGDSLEFGYFESDVYRRGGKVVAVVAAAVALTLFVTFTPECQG